tara:strand:+ start:302 stop:742 length:441 start_codon:yes stop_codon:yes gene_type:complete
MIGLLQRVTEASVDVAGETIATIGAGLVVLIGVERNDTEASANRLLERILAYRVFSDAVGKMNLSLRDIEGDLLLVPQFTLAADTAKGRRPNFSKAAAPEDGERLFDYLLKAAGQKHASVRSGRFGAEMQMRLINSGPVTFWLQTT